nr:SIS domain-containing protein [uncultured Desulfobulbus sp.]
METIMQLTESDEIALSSYFSKYRTALLETDIIPSLLAFRDLCLDIKKKGKKLIFAGNGASASIASQAATDYTQHAGVRTIALNDHNLITAFGNDYGYENWVAKALEAYADPGDVAVLISSSGSSPNIVNAAKYARENNIKCVTFSGFSADNPLRKQGELNLWLDSNIYNIIENTHMIWVLLVATLIENNDGDDNFLRRSLETIEQQLTAKEHWPELVGLRDLCSKVHERGGKVIFAGNGSSSSIASHAATDFTKQSRIRTVAFNDHNLLTAFGNDYGQENWVYRSLEAYADPKDAVVLISSSGRSANILKAADYSVKNNFPLVTFSAFDTDNPLSKYGQINFWADTRNCSLATGLHSAWIFTVADMFTDIFQSEK